MMAFEVQTRNVFNFGLSLARQPVLVGHSEKVGKTQASEFLISTGKRREIPRWVSNSKRDLLLLQNTLGLEGG